MEMGTTCYQTDLTPPVSHHEHLATRISVKSVPVLVLSIVGRGVSIFMRLLRRGEWTRPEN